MASIAMEPTYRCARPAGGCSAVRADILVISRTRRIARGDVVAYKVPDRGRIQCGAGGLFVHRVQRVESGGKLLYVVGDNRSQSCDSRVFGSIPAANVVGKVVAPRRR
jgi:type IV secretory pathway protease TraF